MATAEDDGGGMPRVRAGLAADTDAIASLHATSWKMHYRGAYSDAYLDGPVEAERRTFWRDRFARLESRELVLVAERGTQLVGFICVLLDHDPQLGSLIDNLHVAAQAHGQGLGRRLMHDAGRAMAATAPLRPGYLHVLASNRAAQSFYDRIGGKVVAQERQRMVDGSIVDVLRYVWSSAAALLEGTSRGQRSEAVYQDGAAGPGEVRS